MAQKWLQLIGEDGSALTSATCDVVDSEDVDTFRKAVNRGSSHLAGIAASDFIVFDVKGGALPKESSPVNDPGRDEAHAIIVQSPALTPAEALLIRTISRSSIKSFTRNAIGIREGALPDGPINLSQGQAKSAFYYAYSRFGGILVAKVYGTMYKQEFQRGVDVNFPLGSRTTSRILLSFSSLFYWKLRKQTAENYRTLVGGAVRLGTPIVEITDQFCLDVAKSHGSELLDWTCLGTTLAQLADIDITNYHSRQDLIRYLKDGHESVDTLVGQHIICCLENPSESRIKAVLNRLPNSFC
ncbi:hypothetical protein PsorP6_010832 [Peronosclerospora sorghi]|uniref:Uncharacterized protein n=1 Tax=Peronosclerospora sorghi TaxID=230839 RepID=A0ACC0VWQ9_9STRA|nr:hypothetical protein PsorP6_010832 [Peronosclerospora sorghi]